ncbi:MAG: hypothetical protein IPJ82_03745 [Lewinellaceae bacterium]|nr:hypothetical protein [Lewinellaceae bacterium]
MAVFVLLPFSYPEMENTVLSNAPIEERIYKGAFPGIYDRNTPPQLFYSSYVQT